ncbi:hypothetical protein AHAS_Ahas11G0209500 [Arachis hypogaea]
MKFRTLKARHYLQRGKELTLGVFYSRGLHKGSLGTQRRAQKVGYEETDDNEYENVMEEVGEVDWMKTHWSGQDANEKDEDDSCEKDHYLDVSLSKA